MLIKKFDPPLKVMPQVILDHSFNSIPQLQPSKISEVLSPTSFFKNQYLSRIINESERKRSPLRISRISPIKPDKKD